MTIYKNAQQGSDISSVEFSSAPENLVFFYLRPGADKEKTSQSIASPGTGLEIIAQTQQGDNAVLVAKSAKPKEELLSLLSSRGEAFAPYVPKKPFQPWKWRGALGLVGQSFDMASVYLANQRGSRTEADNAAYFSYASANIAANLVNIVFGANTVPDTQRMRFLKGQVNDIVKPHLPDGSALPSVDDNLSLKLNGPEKPKALGQKIRDYGRRNGVYIDETLRYLGNANLVSPITQWNKPGKQKLNTNHYSIAAGSFLLAGKTVTVFSKIPDPYNPDQGSQMDKVREKVFFRAGTLIEALGLGVMGYNSFRGEVINGVRKTNPAKASNNLIRAIQERGKGAIAKPALIVHNRPVPCQRGV